ncbi:hypothetical protein OG871_38290 [Kitasatospora sp. NBC_00374]|uniref:hypothetical protein n=1 Tax=Kitasatospora sp. NBC_00374 TaxID=2975964 RepID=UPI0030E28D7B
MAAAHDRRETSTRGCHAEDQVKNPTGNRSCLCLERCGTDHWMRPGEVFTVVAGGDPEESPFNLVGPVQRTSRPGGVELAVACGEAAVKGEREAVQRGLRAGRPMLGVLAVDFLPGVQAGSEVKVLPRRRVAERTLPQRIGSVAPPAGRERVCPLGLRVNSPVTLRHGSRSQVPGSLMGVACRVGVIGCGSCLMI